MEGQTTEDKLSVLNTIFGNDLTYSVISNTLREVDNQFDPAVEKLLTLPSNKPQNPPPPTSEPIDTKSMENIQRLHTMFGDLTQSVITTVYESNKRDVEGTVDTLLNITSNEIASGARKEADVICQEQEIRAYVEFKQVQQKLQEQEHKFSEATQKLEAQKKEEIDAQKQEHVRALQEQERMLLEFQRKKKEEDHKMKDEQRTTRQVEADKKSDLQEERIKMERLAEENKALQRQTEIAEKERKILEARMRDELQREDDERKRLIENEKRLLQEQENIKRSWEEQVRKLESEKRLEEQKRIQEDIKRAEIKRTEDEERARQDADMRKILELERLKLEDQRRRVEEEKRSAEERLKVMEEAARKREEEEAARIHLQKEQKRKEEEYKREEAERAYRLEAENQMQRPSKNEGITQDQFSASAVMVPANEDEVTVKINAESKGNEVSGTWSLVHGVLGPQAWLGLFAHRSVNTYVGFAYVRGNSGEFHFKSLTPGHYEVRIFANKPVTSRIAESQPMLIGPKVLSFNAQIQGEHIMLEYKLDPPSIPSNWDWVGIYDKSQRRNKTYLSSTYATGSGTITAVLPRVPGEYEARLFAAGSKYNDQASIVFTVVDNDNVHAERVGDVIKATWVLRTVEPTSSDWIGLFLAGDSTNNNYLASAYTHGVYAGSVDIPLPKDASAGIYELRLFASKVGKYVTYKVSNTIVL